MKIIDNVMPFYHTKKLKNAKLYKKNRKIKNQAFALFTASALAFTIGAFMPDDRPTHYYFNEVGQVKSVSLNREENAYEIYFTNKDYAYVPKSFLDAQPYELEATSHLDVNDKDVTFIKTQGLGLKSFLPEFGFIGMLGSLIYGNRAIKINNEEYITEQKNKARQRRIEKYKSQAKTNK